MSEWQPIDSAPKDGTKIIIFGRWLPYEGGKGGEPCQIMVMWSTVMSNGTGYRWIMDDLSSLGEKLFPNMRTGGADNWNVDWTHWMPLPDPPKAP